MNDNALLDRIDVNPEVLVGKPVIRGTRLAVELILELLSDGWSFEDLLQSYPGISEEDIRACLAYAKEIVEEVRVSSVKS